MNKDNNYIETIEFINEGYTPLVDYDKWRVAVLRYIDMLLPQNIDNFQAHSETDEVFVLLSGRCILFYGDNINNKIENIQYIDMKPNKIYNVKKGIYHTHTLTKDANVFIVENKDTNDENSPKVMIKEEVNNQLVSIVNTIWNLKN